MSNPIKIAVVAALCSAYFVCLVELTGLIAAMPMPWGLYHGKPAWEIYCLESLTDLIRISAASAMVAVPIALGFSDQPFRTGLWVAVPATLYFIWSLYSWPTLVSRPPIAISAAITLYTSLGPPTAATLLCRLRSNHWFKPTGHKKPWPAA